MSSPVEPLRWLAVDLLTGGVVCALPSLQSTDPNRRTLGQYESQSATLYVTPTVSPSWEDGTAPFRSALIAYRDATDPNVIKGPSNIIWGGVVLRRQRKPGSNEVTLTLATPECYLDRRFTGPYTTDPFGTGATSNQNTIVSDLVTQFAVNNQGLPITVVTVDDGNPVPSIRAVYNDYDDKTVYSNLGALSGLLNGPEWTAHWSWDSASNLITPVLYVGNRIGAAVQPGLAPPARFDSANLIDGELDEDYSSRMGANDVTATSTGQGLARPSARSPNPVTTSLNGRPRVQFRYQPATSIQDPLTLQQHADRALALLGEGTNTVTLKAAANRKPQLGIEWQLGDDIGFQFDGPAFPRGFSGIGRCIGYESTDVYTSPVLYVPEVN